MLKRFEVQGFKSFLHPVTIDFSDASSFFSIKKVNVPILNIVSYYYNFRTHSKNLPLA